MKPISLTAVEYLTLNMRDVDKREIYGLRSHDDPFILAREVILASTYGKAAIAEHRGRPCGIIGVSPLWPCVWTVWSFGTDNWSKAVIEMSRYGRQVLGPYVGARGHRLQCESRFDHHDAHRWLMAMGAKPDGLMEGYGRDGAAYIMWSWDAAYRERKAPRVLQGAP